MRRTTATLLNRLRQNGKKSPKYVRRAAPELAVEILPNGVYSITGITQLLRLRRHSLPREIRAKRLVAHKRCGRWWVLGKDVIAWLEQG
jgi:hypothetical protein